MRDKLVSAEAWAVAALGVLLSLASATWVAIVHGSVKRHITQFDEVCKAIVKLDKDKIGRDEFRETIRDIRDSFADATGVISKALEKVTDTNAGVQTALGRLEGALHQINMEDRRLPLEDRRKADVDWMITLIGEAAERTLRKPIGEDPGG